MFVVTVTLKNTKNNCIWTDDMWGWFELVHLGEKYGWKPAGTIDRSGDQAARLDGEYKLPIGQIVTGGDADAFAAALQHALRATTTLIRDPARQRVLSLIEFCRMGEFEIVTPRGSRRASDQGSSMHFGHP